VTQYRFGATRKFGLLGRVTAVTSNGTKINGLRYLDLHKPMSPLVRQARCKLTTEWIGRKYADWTVEVAKEKSNVEDMREGLGFHFRHIFDSTLRELQTRLPWTIRYSRDFRANPQPHKDFTHALLHVGKALGHLQGLADDMDHDRAKADNRELQGQYGKYVADLVVCALRAANCFPGGVLNLQEAVENRIKEKNPPEAEERNVGCSPLLAYPYAETSSTGSAWPTEERPINTQRQYKTLDVYGDIQRSLMRFEETTGRKAERIRLGLAEAEALGFSSFRRPLAIFVWRGPLVTSVQVPVEWGGELSIIQPLDKAPTPHT
jgi:hypothetical protein